MTTFKCTLPVDISKEEFFAHIQDSTETPEKTKNRIQAWDAFLTEGTEDGAVYSFLQEALEVYCEEIRETRK